MAKILSVNALIGTRVVNLEGDDLGKIEEIMLDLDAGHVAYAVLSFGGLLGFGDKLFAVPWEALSVDQGKERILLNVAKSRLKDAHGFDKFDWPDMADPAFQQPSNQPLDAPERELAGVASSTVERSTVAP